MDTAQLNFKVIDQSFSPDNGLQGISGYMGIFKRGPIGKTDDVFSSWSAFRKLYGGLIASSDDPLQVKRLIERGGKVRVCGIRHFTDISDQTSTDATKATPLPVLFYVLSAELVAGQAVTFNLNAITLTQAFTTDSETTLRLLAAQIIAQFSPQIDSVYVLGGDQFQVTLLTGSPDVGTTGSSAPTVETGTITGFHGDDGSELFQLTPKYPGADYNSLRVSVLPGSNGQDNYFDLKIELLSEPDYVPEFYPNLTIPGNPNVAASNYLSDIVKGSQLMDVTYLDLSGLTAPIIPIAITERYATGTDGTTPDITDYIGDSSGKNGLHAFDPVTDIYALGAGSTDDALAVAGAAYAAQRKDLQFFHHFDNALVSASQIVSDKMNLNIDTPYIEFWCGGLVVLDPLTNVKKNITAIGDILGASATSSVISENTGPYRSFAGTQRGLIFNAFGVVNNFGSANDLTNLNLLSNRQINAVVNVDGQIALSGNFSGQLATSHLSFNNVIRLIIYMQRVLRPLLKPFIEEPNDIPTWKTIYLTAHPFMESLKSPKRAIYNYAWQGDQFAPNLQTLLVNNATDVGLGKYRVDVYVQDIVSLQEFNVNIIITDASVTLSSSPINNN